MLPIIGCLPKLLSLIKSFHDGMLSTVQFVGDISSAFGIKSCVKQGCVLEHTLFGIFFALLLKHAFGASSDGVYLHTRKNGRLFNIARLRSNSKTSSHCQRLVFCRRCSYCLSYSEWFAATNGPFFKRMRSVQFDHKSKEDSGDGPSITNATHHQNKRDRSGSCQPVSVFRLNNNRLVIVGYRDQQKKKSRILCITWQDSHQHRSPCQGRHTLHVHPPLTEAPSLDRSCA